MKIFPLLIATISWVGLWLTADQQAQHFFWQEKYVQAAELFTDPNWKGAAYYRAGQFEKAAQAFSRGSSANAKFNEGNAWLLLGKYEIAIDRYDKALAKKPDWKEAIENRALAKARFDKLNTKGGDAGDQRLGADEIVFDKKKSNQGQDTQVAGDQAVSNASVQSLWLRRVQTKPADFLRSKFAYQLSNSSEASDP